MIFDIKRGCTKCGNEGQKVVKDKTVITRRVAADAQYVPDSDKILRTCRRCGYQWIEDCVD